MGYIIKGDYLKRIQEKNLDVVTGNNNNVLDEVEIEVQDEVIGYLKHRYDTVLIFGVLSTVFDFTTLYSIGDIVHLDGPVWVAGTFSPDDIVSFLSPGEERPDVYVNISASTTEDPTDASKWKLLGPQYDFFTALTANSGKQPEFDTSDWQVGDPREKLIVRQMVDIILYEIHSRINPRDIPVFRIDRRDDAIKFLRDSADPRMNVNPPFPLFVHPEKQGVDITWNSNDKINHGQDSY